MAVTSIVRELDLDPRELVRSMVRRPGSLLLEGRRPWSGFERSALLFDPRWVLIEEPEGRIHWSGDIPSPSPPSGPADQLVGLLSQQWRRRPDPRAAFTGLAGMLAYDLGPARWGARAARPAPFSTPLAWIGAFDLALLFDGNSAPHLVVSELSPLVPASRSLEARADEAEEILNEALRAGASSATTARPTPLGEIRFPDAERHARAVRRIQEELRRGEVYQVNLTDFATARCGIDPWKVFEHQSRSNPVPFAAYLDTGTWVLSCHSPELLLALEGDRAMTAPIKGTRPEGEGDTDALRASVKDRAEHVMIVDLCRNDLGVDAAYGSVEVLGLMEPLRLRGLVHLVSRIEARIPQGRRSRILSDLFPGGSITGAPKRRAMEIIAQVEERSRGPYTGSVGYSGRDGRAIWNIAIRTAVWSAGELAFGCGGGIVLDSDPGQEHAEAVLKARSFFDTLEHLTRDPEKPARAATGVQ